MEYKLHTITTLAKLNEVYQYVLDNIADANHFVAYDTETNGPCPISKTIIGFSISLFENEGFYMPFLTMTDERGLCTEAPQPIPKEGENLTHELYDCVSPAFKVRALELLELLKNYKILMHNAPFDIIITRRNYNIDYIKSLYCDTLMLKHTLDCDKPHGLKDCGVKYFGEHAKDEQSELGGSVIRNGGKWTMRDKWVWHGDIYYVGKYACMDTCLTLRLFNHLDPQLDNLNLRDFFYKDEVMPLLEYATIPMKDTGFKIDVNHYKRAKLRLQAEIDDLDQQIRYEVSDVTGPVEQNILDAKYPSRPGGAFGERLITEAGLSLPVSPKTGRFSTAKSVRKAWAEKVIKTATEDQIKVIWYVLGEADKVPLYLIYKVQRLLWEEKMDREIVNLGSAKQFEYIVNTKWGIISPEKTKSGDQSFNAAVIEKITKSRMQELQGLSELEAEARFTEYMECEKLPIEADWFIKFLRKRKLEKLVNAFIDGILNKHINGRIHTDMLQFGTTAGRYASRGPNMQQLPSHSALGAVVKRGFVA